MNKEDKFIMIDEERRLTRKREKLEEMSVDEL